jgi:hypothetical protein
VISGSAVSASLGVSGVPDILSGDADLQRDEYRAVKFSFSVIPHGHSRTGIVEFGKIHWNEVTW